MKIIQQNLKKYADEIFVEMSKIFSADKIDVFKKNFNKNYEGINSDTINYCVEKFVQAELDFITPGDRGIGRLTETLPRLGAYFRNPLSILEKSELDKLDTLMTKLIASGYLFFRYYQRSTERKDTLLCERRSLQGMDTKNIHIQS